MLSFSFSDTWHLLRKVPSEHLSLPCRIPIPEEYNNGPKVFQKTFHALTTDCLNHWGQADISVPTWQTEGTPTKQTGDEFLYSASCTHTTPYTTLHRLASCHTALTHTALLTPLSVSNQIRLWLCSNHVYCCLSTSTSVIHLKCLK